MSREINDRGREISRDINNQTSRDTAIERADRAILEYKISRRGSEIAQDIRDSIAEQNY